MIVSVIVTTYNRPDYLKRVVEGYLQQSHVPDEIIIADDGSTEETASTVKRTQEETNIKIVHIWHEDKGFRTSHIRNKAIAKSSGKYLILTDDDAIPHLKLVEDHLRYAEEGCFIQGHRVLLGSIASKQFHFSNTSLRELLQFSVKGEAHNILNAFRFPLPLIRISQNLKGIRSCNMSFFKKDFIAINGFNEDFEGWGKEDSDLVVRFYKYGLRRKDLKFRACCYHLHHPHYSRENLEGNVTLLKKTQNDGMYSCINGIDKYLNL